MGSSRVLARSARVCALLVGCALAPNASALYVGMYAIGDFVPGASGGCGGDDRGSWPGMAQAWWDEMRARGHYGGPSGSPYKYIDGNMIIRRFCDPSSALSALPGGACQDSQSSWPAGVDWMDAAIIATHGWDDGDHWGGLMRYPWKGECGLRFGGSSDQMSVGDAWIVFLHASSCQSLDDDNVNGVRFAMEKAGTSLRAHQFDGFHGIMWISSSYNGNYKETAKDGHSVDVAHAWVNNHYKSNSQGCEWYDPFNWFGTCQDQCPVGYAISNSLGNALTRLLNERYNFVYGDPPDNSWYAWLAYTSCDPVGENTWNP
jgi:hypothetical protein